MGSQGGEHVFRCPCYDTHTDYQKIVDLRDAGLVIYRQSTRIEDVNSRTNAKQAATKNSEDIFILHNTKDEEIISADIMTTFDQNICCPRCRHIYENAKKLLKTIPKINRNDIVGICDHCRRKLSHTPCQKCDEVVKKFITGRDGAKNAKLHMKAWLSKIHRLLKDVVIAEKHVIKKGRTYSDINIQNIHHNSPISLREPLVGDLFYSETLRTGSTRTLDLSDRSYHSHPNYPKVKKHTTFAEFSEQEYFAFSKNKQFVLRSHQDLTRMTDDGLSLLETVHDDFRVRKSVTDLSLQKLSMIPTEKYKLEEGFQSMSDLSLKKTFKTPTGKYKSEEALKSLSDLSLKKISPGKYKSENDLLTSISGFGADDFIKEGFGYLFLKEKDEKKRLLKKSISSSELIKNTQDMLQARAEEEKKRQEEERNKKQEEQERKRKAREEKRIQAEKERLSREIERLAKEEAKRLAEEEKKRLAEEEKLRLAEEKAKRLAEEEEKKRAKEEQKKLSAKDKEKKPPKDKPDSVKKKQVAESPKEKKKIPIETKKKDDEKQKTKEPLPEKPSKVVEKPPKVIKEVVEKPKKEKPEPVIKEKEIKKIKDDPPKEKQKKEVPDKETKEPAKPKTDEAPVTDFKKLLAEQAKQKEEMEKLKKQQQEEERKAREAAEKIVKENAQVKAPSEIKPKKPQTPPETESKPQTKQEKPTTKELNIKQIKVRKPSGDDLILQLVKLKQTTPGETKTIIKKKELDVDRLILQHKGHKTKNETCIVCKDSNIELDLESIANLKQEDGDKMADIIIGQKIFKYKPPLTEKHIEEEVLPILFKSCFKEESVIEKEEKVSLKIVPDEIESSNQKKPFVLSKGSKGAEQEVPNGIIRYALSDRAFIDKGWTMLPTEKVVRKMNVYRMRPAQPEFDWFEHNKNKRLMQYDTGEKLAEFDDNGRGRWYYKNGRLALDYYDAEETNAQQRYVVYSSGEPDERGRSRPITILGTFDYLGNGVVFDHSGKIRLKYNQTEGVVLDRAIGPVSHWKWHTLNDPPVLQQVMIDTQMSYKDPDIVKLGGPGDNKARPDNEEMLAIEFDNFIKEKSKKLTQKFKPFQIKMKALKINESFSLKVLDQATVYLIFRDGSANLKLNIGMILDHKEIVDTDTAEVGEVSNSLERLPARTDSIAGMQASVAHAARVERQRLERERRLRPKEPCGSADRLVAAASRPLRAPFRTASSGTSVQTSGYCKCRKPSSSNLYYDTRLV